MGNIKRNKKQSKTLPKSRKELRKNERKMKKQRRVEYFSKRRKPGKFDLLPPVDGNPYQTEKKPKNKTKNALPKPSMQFGDIENEKQKQIKLEREMRKQRKKQLINANLKEDQNIKQLEKQLKLNKRKSKTIPKTFASEGLDYILEVCDSENIKGINVDQEKLDSDGEFDEDFALMVDRPKNVGYDTKFDSDNDTESMINSADEDMDKSNSNNEGEDSSDNENNLNGNEESEIESLEDEDSDIVLESDVKSNRHKRVLQEGPKYEDNHPPTKKQRLMLNEFSNSDSDLDDESDNEGNETKSETWEDIYGRIRTKDGSVISNNSGKYVPPAVRAKLEGGSPENKKRIEKLTRLKKQIKGLLNRLAEANIHSISSQIEDLYMNNSRNDMNDIITNIMFESLTSKVITPERLLIEHVLLVIVLHANVGTEVGAHFVHAIVKQFDELFNSKQEVENKMLDNTVNVIAQLYNFKIFHSKLLYKVLSKLSNKFDEKSVECILSVLKSVGFSLRKDDPLALKELITELQKQASSASEETKQNSRVKYMLDVLLAIKNNNVSKIPNYDTSYSEHLKKLQKNFVRKGNYVTQLNISLDDLLQADQRGRWWIVGSAWSGTKEENIDKSKTVKTEGYSQKLLELARKQRMNTDTRRSIFCIIMSAEDYVDAFEKLLHLGLKNQQEREIINVILHCCLQENEFNPYYAVLAQKFCDCDRKYQMIIKCSVWDKVKALSDCSASQISNLAKLLTHLFIEKALPISTLKIMEFGELDKLTLRFMRQILLGILLCEDVDSCTAVFEKVAQSDKLKMFRESLKLFIHHFLLKNLQTDKIPEEKKKILKLRCDVVEKMLTVNDRNTRF